MRLIDGDALTDEIMERYCKECDNRKGIKDGKYRIIYEVGDAPCRACPMDDMKDELDNAPTIDPEPKWIPCKTKKPEGVVLVTVETITFNRYVCDAVWIPRWTWKASFDSWEDCSEYNEDEDEYYVLEGWYERVHNWDEYSYVGIEDAVLAWMPLPEPWRGEES